MLKECGKDVVLPTPHLPEQDLCQAEDISKKKIRNNRSALSPCSPAGHDRKMVEMMDRQIL